MPLLTELHQEMRELLQRPVEVGPLQHQHPLLVLNLLIGGDAAQQRQQQTEQRRPEQGGLHGGTKNSGGIAGEGTGQRESTAKESPARPPPAYKPALARSGFRLLVPPARLVLQPLLIWRRA